MAPMRLQNDLKFLNMSRTLVAFMAVCFFAMPLASASDETSKEVLKRSSSRDGELDREMLALTQPREDPAVVDYIRRLLYANVDNNDYNSNIDLGLINGMDNDESEMSARSRWLAMQRRLRLQKLRADAAGQRPKRRGSCLFHAGLGHNCDYRDLVGAVNEASYWGSDNAPGKK